MNLAFSCVGKRAFIAGVADDNGYGWAIAKSLAAAGAEILVGTWVPVSEAQIVNVLFLICTSSQENKKTLIFWFSLRPMFSIRTFSCSGLEHF